MMLEVKSVSCGYEKKVILKNISFTLAPGELLCLLGPNGVGKTTLFKTILGSLKLMAGEILLDGQDITTLDTRHFARKVGYVPQAHTPPFPFRVIDVVTMGRTAHFCMFSLPSEHDTEVADEVLETMNISHLREKAYTEISGGERQLVLIARALAQQPEILVMDEPTANLDFGNQIKVLEYIREISRTRGISVLLTMHSPNHALAYATKVAVLERNGDFIVGCPEKVISEKYIRDTYQVNAELLGIKTKRGEIVTICVPLLSA
jgi:iron complex transport system ATP-binding protein